MPGLATIKRNKRERRVKEDFTEKGLGSIGKIHKLSVRCLTQKIEWGKLKKVKW
jgi:hypothetical protein